MDLSLSFLAGFLGSLHCVGMCGAIVLAYSTQRSATMGSIPGHLIYNAGRVLSYMLVGALAGSLGGAINLIRETGIWLSVVGGAAMVIAGFLMVDFLPWLNVWSPGDPTWLRKMHLASVTNLLTLRSAESRFYVGLLTPLIPCGLLYSMFIKAASTGSAAEGAMTMLVFGLGIVPALLLTGVVSSYIGVVMRYYANRLAAVTIILMGVVMIMRGVGMPLPLIPNSHDGPSHPELRMPEHHH